MSIDPMSSYYDHGGIETIEIIRAKLTPEQCHGYLLGNVIKYACRLQWAGKAIRDAEKLAVYAALLRDELSPPPESRQAEVRERYDYSAEAATEALDLMAEAEKLRTAWEQHPPNRLVEEYAARMQEQVEDIMAEPAGNRSAPGYCRDGAACRLIRETSGVYFCKPGECRVAQ